MDYEIKEIRNRIGSFLHDYYMKFGEVKYDRLVEEMGAKMELQYGEAFNSNNLRIMEAEYVVIEKINEKIKFKNKKITS